jgi:hypothetical protein
MDGLVVVLVEKGDEMVVVVVVVVLVAVVVYIYIYIDIYIYIFLSLCVCVCVCVCARVRACVAHFAACRDAVSIGLTRAPTRFPGRRPSLRAQRSTNSRRLLRETHVLPSSSSLSRHSAAVRIDGCRIRCVKKHAHGGCDGMDVGW